MPDAYVVLGNHDFAISRDPFSQPRRDRRPRRTGRCSPTRSSTYRASRAQGRARRARPAHAGSRQQPGRVLPTRRPTCASCSRTFPRRSTASSRGVSTSSLAGHLHGGQIVAALRLRPAAARASRASRHAQGSVRPQGDADPRFAGPRHDLRPDPVLRAPRGDRTRSTIRVMEGHSVISPDVLARYAADAALRGSRRA